MGSLLFSTKRSLACSNISLSRLYKLLRCDLRTNACGEISPEECSSWVGCARCCLSCGVLECCCGEKCSNKCGECCCGGKYEDMIETGRLETYDTHRSRYRYYKGTHFSIRLIRDDSPPRHMGGGGM